MFKNIIKISIRSLLISSAVFASETVKPVNQENKELKKQEKFTEAKRNILKKMKENVRCVEKSTTFEQLKQCKPSQEEKEKMKQKREEIKSKKSEMKKQIPTS